MSVSFICSFGRMSPIIHEINSYLQQVNHLNVENKYNKLNAVFLLTISYLVIQYVVSWS